MKGALLVCSIPPLFVNYFFEFFLMRVSRRAFYGLQAMLGLVGCGVVAVSGLAGAVGVPLGFLEKILLDLRRAGVVGGGGGAQGGYFLAMPPGDISVVMVFEALGEEFVPQGDGSFGAVLEGRLGEVVRRCWGEISLEDLYFDWCSWRAARSGLDFMV